MWFHCLVATYCQIMRWLATSAQNQAYSAWAWPALCAGWHEYLAIAGRVNRHIAWHTSPRARGLAVFAKCLAGGWLAEISADLREAVAH